MIYVTKTGGGPLDPQDHINIATLLATHFPERYTLSFEDNKQIKRQGPSRDYSTPLPRNPSWKNLAGPYVGKVITRLRKNYPHLEEELNGRRENTTGNQYTSFTHSRKQYPHTPIVVMTVERGKNRFGVKIEAHSYETQKRGYFSPHDFISFLEENRSEIENVIGYALRFTNDTSLVRPHADVLIERNMMDTDHWDTTVGEHVEMIAKVRVILREYVGRYNDLKLKGLR